MMLQALHTRFWIVFLLIPSSSVGLDGDQWQAYVGQQHRKYTEKNKASPVISMLTFSVLWNVGLHLCKKTKKQSCNDLSFCIKINQQGISGISISIKGAQPVSILPGKNFSVDDSGIPALCSGRLLEAVPGW